MQHLCHVQKTLLQSTVPQHLLLVIIPSTLLCYSLSLEGVWCRHITQESTPQLFVLCSLTRYESLCPMLSNAKRSFSTEG